MVAPAGTRANSRRRGDVAVVIVGAVLLVPGYLAMFSQFLEFDDEGYLLVTLSEFARRGALYDQVYSQYGPFYYVVFGLPARVLGLDWGMTAGRVIQLGTWIAISVLVGLVVVRLTRRIGFAVLAELLAFFLLESLIKEPMHPGALLTLLVVGLVALQAVVRPSRPAVADIASGAVVAALVLTKVNVGAFALLTLGITVLASSAGWRRHRVWRGAIDLAIVAIGPLLLLSNGREAWKVAYASVYVVAAVAVVVVSRSWDDRAVDAPPFDLRRLGAGALGTAVVTLGAAIATGTTPSALVAAVVTRPAALAQYHTVVLEIAPVALLWLLAIPAYLLLRRARPSRGPRAGPLVSPRASGSMRIVAGLALVATVFGLVPGAEVLLAPLAVLALVPRTVDRGGIDPTARRLLVAMAVTNLLQAYPVAGTQVSLSLLLPLVCAVVVVSDGVTEWRAAEQREPQPWGAYVPVLAVGVLVAVLFGNGQAYFSGWIDRYANDVAVGLPGTDLIRLPPDQVASLTWVADTVRARCDVVFAEGFNSFHLFSGRKPVTGYNATIWRILLNDREQQAVVDGLRASPGPVCTIRPHSGLVAGAGPPPGPLSRYLDESRWTRLVGPGHFDVYLREP